MRSASKLLQQSCLPRFGVRQHIPSASPHQCSGNSSSPYDLRFRDGNTVQFAVNGMDRDDTSDNDLNSNRIRFCILYIWNSHVIIYTFFGVLFKRE